MAEPTPRVPLRLGDITGEDIYRAIPPNWFRGIPPGYQPPGPPTPGRDPLGPDGTPKPPPSGWDPGDPRGPLPPGVKPPPVEDPVPPGPPEAPPTEPPPQGPWKPPPEGPPPNLPGGPDTGEGFDKGMSPNTLQPSGGKDAPTAETAPPIPGKLPSEPVEWNQVNNEKPPPEPIKWDQVLDFGTPGVKGSPIPNDPSGGKLPPNAGGPGFGTYGGTWPGGSTGTWGGTGQNVARLTDSISDPRYAVVGGQGGYGLGAVGPRYTGPYWRDVPKVPQTTPPNPSNPTVAPPLSPFNVNGIDVNLPPWLQERLGVPADGGAKPPPGTTPPPTTPPGETPPPGTKPPGETPPGETPPGAKPGPGGEVPGKPPPTGDPNAPIPGAPNPPTTPPPTQQPGAQPPGMQTTGTPQHDFGGLPPIQARTAPPAGFVDVTNNLDQYMPAAEKRAMQLFGPYWSSPQNMQYALRQELDSKGAYSKRVDDYFNLRLSKPKFNLTQYDAGGQPMDVGDVMNMQRFGQGAIQKWAADNGVKLPEGWQSYATGQDYAAPGLPGGAPPARMPGTPAPLTPAQRAEVLAMAKTKQKGDRFTMNGRTYFLNQNGALVDVTDQNARTRITDIYGNPIGAWA